MGCHTPGTASGRSIANFPHRRCSLLRNQGAAPTYEILRLRRALGVELELGVWGKWGGSGRAFQQMLAAMPHFAGEFVRDGSVTPSGMELVSRKMEGDAILTGLKELCQALHGSKAAANETCGMHVHVDSADMSMFDLRRVLLGWIQVQPLLWGTLVQNARQHNHYCEPITLSERERSALLAADTSAAITEWFYQWLYGMSKAHYEDSKGFAAAIRKRREHKYENPARRKTLNFHSWMMRGTLEFRLKEGTTDPGDLLWWPQWCGWLIDRLARSTDREIREWEKGLLTGRDGSLQPFGLLALTESFHPSCAALGLTQWVRDKINGIPSTGVNTDEIAF